MNFRLHRRNLDLIRLGTPLTLCLSGRCKAYHYPTGSFCDACSPPDPPFDNSLVGYPVVDLGSGLKGGSIAGVASSHFYVYFPGVSSSAKYDNREWLKLVEPDFSRVIVIDYALTIAIPKNCHRCNKVNEFDTPAGNGNNWVCMECKIIRSMW